MKKPKEEALALCEKLNIKLTVEDKENNDKQLLKVQLGVSHYFAIHIVP